MKLTFSRLLKTIFGLELVKSEFSLNNFRIDTLAFDRTAQSFVILEYKRDKNFSVIDQGYAYLSLMLNNKSDFILEFNENLLENLKRKDVDWTQSKVVFISPSFTIYQKEAINFRDLPIELWEIKKYENQTINFNHIKSSGAKESIKTISRGDKSIEKINKEIKVYTEADHISNGNPEMQELYERLKERIIDWDDTISFQIKKQTIKFKTDENIFLDVLILVNSLKLFLNLKSGELQDERAIARDVSNIGHWGNGSYEIKMLDTENLEYILSLIKQSLKLNRNIGH